ncbi:MAG TPA: ABC transporter permease subunit [Candidatus Brocadiia bacterium]|nr:ABC transporter permease subunit [Candidatus Brocadiia bacterium]
MPIIGNVGRRSLKVRLLNITIHLVLLAGSATMIYPFMVMLSGSVKSAVDSRVLDAIPTYFYDQQMLYRKWIEAKYNETTDEYMCCYPDRLFAFERADLPARPVEQRYRDWNEFLKEAGDKINEFHYSLGQVFGQGVKPEMLRKFVHEVKKEPDVDGSLDAFNRKYDVQFPMWDTISVPIMNLTRRSTPGDFSAFLKRFVEFAKAQDQSYRNYYSLDSFFAVQTLRPRHGQTVRQLNEKLKTSYRSWSEVTLDRRVPDGPLRKDWIDFVKLINLHYIRVAPEALPAFRAYLKEKYKDIAVLNDPRRYGANYKSFDEIPLFTIAPRSGVPFADWDYFVNNVAKPEHLTIVSLETMYRDFLRRKYGSLDKLIEAQAWGVKRIEDLALPEKLEETNAALDADWTAFLLTIHEKGWVWPDPGASDDYRKFLCKPFSRDPVDMEAINKAYGLDCATPKDIRFPHARPDNARLAERWEAFAATAPEASDDFQAFVTRPYTRDGKVDMASLNKALGTQYAKEEEITLPVKAPENLAMAEQWRRFLRAQPYAKEPSAWRKFITRDFPRDPVDIKALNAALGTNYSHSSSIFAPRQRPSNPKLAAKWDEFVRNECPKRLLRVDTKKAGAAWTAFLKAKYATADNLNRAYALVPASFDQIRLPTEDVDYYNFRRTRGHAFWEFFTRNYAIVMDLMMYSGSAIFNTVVYCLLAIVGALIVNPMAAYALSRYKPPSQYKLLLFLMLTMAFPPMVLGIPTFLIVRGAGMLNTFWALLLPGIANGYSIFLLKGFFDSLPRELYESAMLDGASEWTMFWQITMATSKPILAVIALQSFQAAYANFMLAFLLCQNPKMWTIMVHIYQLQQGSAQGVVFASLVIAALPTLLVFIFCQNMIMRGIVVPTEK